MNDMIDSFKLSENKISQQKEVTQVTWIGMGVNAFLVMLKLSVGILGSSQALIADAVHSFSDIISDVAILFGAKHWSAPPDDDHPYGHKRIETIISASIGFIMVAAALSIGYKALITIKEYHSQAPGMIAFVGAALSILFKEILFHYTWSVGKRVKSPAVIANAWHHRSDSFSSIPVAVAVIVAVIRPAWSFVDHAGALIVSVFILHAAWKIIKPAIYELVDTDSCKDVHKAVEKVALNIKEVRSVHAIRVRKMSSSLVIDLHILVQGDFSVRQGHDISTEVKVKIMASNPDIVDVIVHVEPAD